MGREGDDPLGVPSGCGPTDAGTARLDPMTIARRAGAAASFEGRRSRCDRDVTMSLRVLVAGGTGYLGGYAIESFKRRGHFVRALARTPKKLGERRGLIDEVVAGEVTAAQTLRGCCDGIDVVFSSVGITRQTGKLSFRDVDYRGNLNLMEEARRAGVKTFIYTSVFNARNLLHLEIVRAHEDFVGALRESGLDYRVIRPTGYFSDMGEFLGMARRGRVWLIGDGSNRINPIHGADLAEFCVGSIEQGERELDVGGPQTLSAREIGALALATLGKPVRISSLPLWLTRLAVSSARFVDPHRGELLAFITTMASTDVVCPNAFGEHLLAEHFRRLRGDA